MDIKKGIRNFFCFILGLIGFIISIFGIIGTVKGDRSTYIIMLIIGIILFVLGAILTKYKNPKNKKIILGCFAGIMAIAAIIGLNTDTETEKLEKQAIENAKWVEKDNHIEAYIMMQKFVKEKLKSPSTAKFPALDFKHQTRDDHVYYIEGYVDSQNSFGAVIRTEFAGTIQQEDYNKWKLLKLALE